MNWQNNKIFRIFSLASIVFLVGSQVFSPYKLISIIPHSLLASLSILIIGILLFTVQFILFVLMKKRNRSDKCLFIISLSIATLLFLIRGFMILASSMGAYDNY